jgi:hypothetical protein
MKPQEEWAFDLEELAAEELERVLPVRADEIFDQSPNDPPEGPEWWELT